MALAMEVFKGAGISTLRQPWSALPDSPFGGALEAADGDQDLRADVRHAYCGLIERYCYSFDALVSHLRCTHLILFNRFREEFPPRRPPRRALREMSKFEIWDVFAPFAGRLMEQSRARTAVREILRYEATAASLLRQPPVREVPGARWTGGAFRPRSATRLFRTNFVLPWMTEDGLGEQCFLLYATPDRLQARRLSPAVADLFELLDDLNRAPEANPEVYETIAESLRPFFPLGVFESVPRPSGAGR